MANTIEDMINDLIHDQVNEVVEDKIEENHRIDDHEGRFSSLEERLDDLLEAIRSEYKDSKLEEKIKHI